MVGGMHRFKLRCLIAVVLVR